MLNEVVGNFKIESDGLQFILSRKTITKETKKTKAENIGKEKWLPVGYYSKKEHLINAIDSSVLMNNDSFRLAAEEFRKLNVVFSELVELLKIEEKNFKKTI